LGLLLLVLATPAVSAVFHQVRQLGPWLLMLGFLMLIGAALRSAFKRHRAGPLALYTEPSRYLSMKFTDSEIWAFKVGSCIALSGVLVIAVASIAQG